MADASGCSTAQLLQIPTVSFCAGSAGVAHWLQPSAGICGRAGGRSKARRAASRSYRTLGP